MSSIFFKPLQVGDIQVTNRIVMAPLTRQRAGIERVPNELMLKYYCQRATAGLIITEATSITPMGVGYEDTPGIWSQKQIEGWNAITNAVHQKQGKIFLQLWHVGRISDPYFLHGELPVAPSAIQPAGHVSLIRPQRPYVTPRALETREVMNLVKSFKQAGVNAKEAGFDGVEIHAANGYLIDQFLQSSTNHRTDNYGGSIANRARFLLEIVDALIDVWGAGRIGVHLAPACDSHDMGDDDPKATFSYVARELGRRSLAFIFTREGQSEHSLTPLIKQEFGGIVIANQGLDVQTAQELLDSGQADAISWGRYFISNPDLVARIQQGVDFAPFNPQTFYTKGPDGYVDYPTMS